LIARSLAGWGRARPPLELFRKGLSHHQFGKKLHRAGWRMIDVVATPQQQPPPTAMQLKTILNHVEKQTGFVYAEARFSEDHSKILVTRKPHARSRPICSGCGKKRPGYDTRPTRRFEFIPLRAIALFFFYAMRRVDCPRCAVEGKTKRPDHFVSRDPFFPRVVADVAHPLDFVVVAVAGLGSVRKSLRRFSRPFCFASPPVFASRRVT